MGHHGDCNSGEYIPRQEGEGSGYQKGVKKREETI